MSVNETLASWSNIALYSAMAAYTGSFLAFTVDLARGAGEQPRSVPAQQQPALAGATVGGAAVDGATVDGAATTASGSDASAAGHTAHGRDAGGDAGRVRRPAAGIGVSLSALALLLHVAAVVLRGVAVERPPWGNMYEFATAGAAVVTLIFLAALRWRELRYLGAFVIGPVLLTLGLSVAVLYTDASELVPSLRSYWLAIHVSVAFIASALFTIAFSVTVLYLVQERRGPQRRLRGVPGAAELDRLSYQLHAAAFPLWTFTIVAGAIWAENAWGRYWGWDPKETWSFVIFVVYAGYLHARATRGWEGRKAAYLAAAGFACLLFNFLVVNIVFVGWHSYAGVG